MATDVFIFVPAYGQQVSVATMLTTHAIRHQLGLKGIGGGISALSFPDIAELRGMATTIWYDTMPQSSHILFIDNDMGFPADMITDMILFDEGVVGTIYRQRKEPTSWAGSGTGTTMAERRGNFMRVEGVGFGVTLVKREVITKMVEAYPELIDTRLSLHPAGDTIRQAGTNRLFRFFEKLDVPERGLISEDLAFCIRWNKICGEASVWGAIGYRISHVGPYDYAGRYLDMVEEERKKQEAAAALPVVDTQDAPTAPDGAMIADLPTANLVGGANGGYPPILSQELPGASGA